MKKRKYVKAYNFDCRGGIDCVLDRSISGKAMTQIFIPSMLIGGGYERSIVECYCDNLEILVRNLELTSLQIDFSEWGDLLNTIYRIINIITEPNIISEMRAIAQTYKEKGNENYRKCLFDLLMKTDFSSLTKNSDYKEGNILMPYVVFYKHTKEMVSALFDYENEIDKVRAKYTKLLNT